MHGLSLYVRENWHESCDSLLVVHRLGGWALVSISYSFSCL